MARFHERPVGCSLHPSRDHHIRGFSIIGEDERCLWLFEQLYIQNPADFPLGSISNMLFMALGSEQLPLDLVSTLVAHFKQLSAKSFASVSSPVASVASRPLRVNEKPLLVVVSSDLRQHPVGRFWLPIARQLRSQFQVISVAGNRVIKTRSAMNSASSLTTGGP